MYLTLLSFQRCYSVQSFYQAGVCHRIEAESSKRLYHACTFTCTCIIKFILFYYKNKLERESASTIGGGQVNFKSEIPSNIVGGTMPEPTFFYSIHETRLHVG